MLVGFLGAPISGKTTTAALLFASLKDSGFVAEFLPEQARIHIAFKKFQEAKDGSSRPLNDLDQLEILEKQLMMERVFSAAKSRSIVITDCAAFLALLYMSPRVRAREDVLKLAIRSAGGFDLLFRCHPVQPGNVCDPNRAHSFEQSQVLDTQLEAVLGSLGIPSGKIIELAGPSKVRSSRAVYEVMEKLLCRR